MMFLAAGWADGHGQRSVVRAPCARYAGVARAEENVGDLLDAVPQQLGPLKNTSHRLGHRTSEKFIRHRLAYQKLGVPDHGIEA